MRTGFTLIEVLVGLTVASLALMAGMAALGFVGERSRHAEAATLDAVAGATQRALLVDWLTSARFRAPTGEQLEGFPDEASLEPSDLLLLPTTARTPIDHGTTVVGLFIDTDPETPERGLVAAMTGPVLGPEPSRMELVPQAGAMHVRYLPDADGAVWETEWIGRDAMPRLIEITLLPAPGDSLPLLLRYPIRAAPGIGR